jgi:hypothetical protein
MQGGLGSRERKNLRQQLPMKLRRAFTDFALWLRDMKNRGRQHVAVRLTSRSQTPDQAQIWNSETWAHLNLGLARTLAPKSNRPTPVLPWLN